MNAAALLDGGETAGGLGLFGRRKRKKEQKKADNYTKEANALKAKYNASMLALKKLEGEEQVLDDKIALAMRALNGLGALPAAAIGIGASLIGKIGGKLKAAKAAKANAEALRDAYRDENENAASAVAQMKEVIKGKQARLSNLQAEAKKNEAMAIPAGAMASTLAAGEAGRADNGGDIIWYVGGAALAGAVGYYFWKKKKRGKKA